jgi:chromosome segregation ATPase
MIDIAARTAVLQQRLRELAHAVQQHEQAIAQAQQALMQVRAEGLRIDGQLALLAELDQQAKRDGQKPLPEHP